MNSALHPGAAEVLGTDARHGGGTLGILPFMTARVRESQARRWIVYEAPRHGSYHPWDHQPVMPASESVTCAITWT